jgi:predicted enzyme related to lactoylglutathione lyase
VNGDELGPTVAQIEHIALATNHLDRLADFYSLLGAAASPRGADPDTGLRTCVLDFCGFRLELSERPRSGAGASGDERPVGLVQLGFALESADTIDELSGVFAAAGHRVLEPPHRAGELGRYVCVVVDPDGNRLKLMV